MAQGGHRSRLQPVDADWLLKPGRVLELRTDEVASLQHLGRSLGKARFVPVEGRQGDKARQAGGQDHQSGDGASAPVVSDSLQQGGDIHDALVSTRKVRFSALTAAMNVRAGREYTPEVASVQPIIS